VGNTYKGRRGSGIAKNSDGTENDAANGGAGHLLREIPGKGPSREGRLCHKLGRLRGGTQVKEHAWSHREERGTQTTGGRWSKDGQSGITQKGVRGDQK